MGVDMIHFELWQLVLGIYLLLLYYTWPIILILDVFTLYRIKKCIKDKEYGRASRLIFAAVFMSGSLIAFIIWINLYN
ncbi:hypothetical protein CKY12_23530 [Photorhabdus sp. S12-55]|uniref:Photorhabdus luminescens subsp. laumondii TTO1 complete genome segment 12/17 n=1 Tax=Photorhabdus laumondii subsp. laumondii (strain DSM 15139 / CIP 105565 / TT01) TaxID=243265 RepID=Q7N260_PHOLL|nr:hypothetical protein PluDJC_16535 [Photorhabdus laumondii subsp. laumondii]RAW63858.1 hypothetical protein CKY15_23730 [Photorhabdus sp. S7-51]RAW64994.1 hypothetical protein CKY14_23755 [Photorhabdus sp. S14-60]RAW69812.1 hypothetical protein CKY06_23855 [Photorhabdus sp. S15-56]RAW78305.1 hypothetical protein CKY09_23405 [Photorhabdus sp. S5P8-50]RAW78538.1 hypothetical protein CKY12_23530 [Photorhabdus sp. S12-55]CAE15608.1 unnamed protein product [Photorhabdus laumondii subsp. laumondi